MRPLSYRDRGRDGNTSWRGGRSHAAVLSGAVRRARRSRRGERARVPPRPRRVLRKGETVSRMTRLLAVTLLVVAPCAALAAEAVPASPVLPPDHWAVQAAERLHELGLAPDWLPAQRAAPLRVVGRALQAAAERDAGAASGGLARAWLERFRSEFPGALAPPEARRPALLGGALEAGYRRGTAQPLPSPAAPSPAALRLVAPRSDPFAEARAGAALGSHLAAGARLRATPWQADAPQLEAVGAVGSFALSVGEGPVGYGPNDVGAVVASGAAPLERIELMTTAPVRLPGP